VSVFLFAFVAAAIPREMSSVDGIHLFFVATVLRGEQFGVIAAALADLVLFEGFDRALLVYLRFGPYCEDHEIARLGSVLPSRIVVKSTSPIPNLHQPV
jgi:hypothetical protein